MNHTTWPDVAVIFLFMVFAIALFLLAGFAEAARATRASPLKRDERKDG